MDLYAFAQMGRFTELMGRNQIDIPRLRGVRWMGEEEVVSEEEIKRDIFAESSWVLKQAVTSTPRFSLHPLWHEYSEWTDRLKRYYLIEETYEERWPDCVTGQEKTVVQRDVVGARWDRIHGKNRKNLKYMLKKKSRAVRRQADMHNKYVGRKDVLKIHARIGGKNWVNYDAHLTVEKQPWFLEKVDDSFDRTYCDIYVLIQPIGASSQPDANMETPRL